MSLAYDLFRAATVRERGLKADRMAIRTLPHGRVSDEYPAEYVAHVRSLTYSSAASVTDRTSYAAVPMSCRLADRYPNTKAGGASGA